MSTTPVCTDNSATPLDRRLQVRQQVSALAYLDIGPANGGIILNLSEEGMGFQAVSPLDGQTEINLSIQLPHSESRIEAVAKIAWLSESSRQGGVHFIEMSPEARAQIHDWISSQGSPKVALDGALINLDSATDCAAKPEGGRASRDKWLSLMAEFEAREPRPEGQRSTATGAERCDSDSVAGEVVAKPATPPMRIVLNPFSQRARTTYTTPGKPSINREPDFEAASAKSRPDHPENSQGSDYSTVIASAFRKSEIDGCGPDQPAGPPRIVAQAVQDALTVPTKAALARQPELPAAAADDEANLEAIISSTRSAALAARSQTGGQKWLGVAALFVLFSALCFGIGTWVGSLTGDRPAPVASAPSTPSTSAQNGEPDADASSAHQANQAPLSTARKDRAVVSHDSPAQTRKHQPASSVKLPAIVPVREQIQSVPAKPILTPLTTSKAPESTQVPAPPDYAAGVAAPVPQIVAGRTLRPTDRFNPCHLTYRVEPTYPAEAQQQRMEGAVRIHQVIGPDGSVQSVKLLSGPPLLAPAALEAAKYWRYLPALLNGQPVVTEQDIEIDFRLPR